MKKRLIDPDLKLYIKLDKILWKEWDPIGVNKWGDDVRDEYRPYLHSIYECIQLNKSKEEISDYLFYIETEYMGLQGNKKNCDRIASLVLDAGEPFLK